ncbi:MAG: RNA polymerase sigma factor SigJ, partial [Devosia sp.]
QKGLDLASAFFDASQTGDLGRLKSILAADVTFVADGGGKRPAGPAPIVGREAVLAFIERLSRLLAQRPSRLLRFGMINGLPGFVTREADGVLQTTAFDVEDGRIAAVYVMRNPDKLRHLEATLH